jgi:hypothetical protein
VTDWRVGDFCKGDDGFPARYLRCGLCLKAFHDSDGNRAFSIKEVVEGDIWYPRDGVLPTKPEVDAALVMFDYLEGFLDKALDILGGSEAKLRRPPKDWERL